MNARCPNCRGPLAIPPDRTAPLKCPGCGANVRVKPRPVAAPLPENSVTQSSPPPAEPADPFAFADEPVIARNRVPRKRSGGPLWALFGLLVVAGLVGGAFALKLIPTPVATATAATGDLPVVAEVKASPAKAIPLPRRLLVMSVSKYLYCNRLAAGTGRNGVDLPTEIGRRLAFDWRVPQEPGNQQLVVLSDTAPDPRPMLKPIITQTLADFCRTSRSQDRVLVYFGGHAVEAGGKAYLVPADGDLAEPDGLIPLDEVWAKLKDCPAAQKVIVFDVCRMNEDDDRVRPGGEPMTPELEKLLLAAPPGVQVVLTCSAGQQAREFRRTPADPTAGDVSGSLFLSGIRHVAARGKLSATPPKADDPLPVADWVGAVGKRMEAVCDATGQKKATPKTGGALPTLAPADPADPSAEVVTLPVPAPGLSPAEVAKYTAAIALPPIRERPTAGDDEVSVPFAAARMTAYAPTPAGTPLRTAAVETLAEVGKLWAKTSASDQSGGLTTEFVGATTDDAFKKSVARSQETPAALILALGDREQKLDALAVGLKDESSAYWRATFVYAQAQVKARLVLLDEYNLLLGDIRTDRLPARDAAKGETGVQMVSSAKLRSGKAATERAAAAAELFDAIAKEHAGTPWAVAAKRARAEALGLEWRPFAPGGKLKTD